MKEKIQTDAAIFVALLCVALLCLGFYAIPGLEPILRCQPGHHAAIHPTDANLSVYVDGRPY